MLADPTLGLRDNNGTLLISNNDWQDNPVQAALITAAGLAPSNNSSQPSRRRCRRDLHRVVGGTEQHHWQRSGGSLRPRRCKRRTADTESGRDADTGAKSYTRGDADTGTKSFTRSDPTAGFANPNAPTAGYTDAKSDGTMRRELRWTAAGAAGWVDRGAGLWRSADVGDDPCRARRRQWAKRVRERPGRDQRKEINFAQYHG